MAGCTAQTPGIAADAIVVDVNVPRTPPTVSVVVTDVLLEPELVCRTHTVWLLPIVPATLVKGAVQPIE